MESQPPNPEFRIISENFHPCDMVAFFQKAPSMFVWRMRWNCYIYQYNTENIKSHFTEAYSS